MRRTGGALELRRKHTVGFSLFADRRPCLYNHTITTYGLYSMKVSLNLAPYVKGSYCREYRVKFHRLIAAQLFLYLKSIDGPDARRLLLANLRDHLALETDTNMPKIKKKGK